MKRVLFWTTFVPLGLLLVVLGILGWPYQIYRGGVFVFMELLQRFERWCFDDPYVSGITLKQAFMEGFEQ